MDNIFDLDDDIVTIPEDVDYVDQLVGEGKKFKDIAALAKGKAESDAYIERMKKQLEEATKELSTRMTLEKFLEANKGRSEDNTGNQSKPDGDEQRSLDEATLLSKMEELLARRETQKTQESNLERTTRVLTEQFGDRYAQVVNHKAKELGMSGQELTALAAKSPVAFFQLIGVSEGERSSSIPVVPRNQVNSSGQPGLNSVRDAKYYERMKTTDPKRYFAPETTSEMIRDLKALGEARFYAN